MSPRFLQSIGMSCQTRHQVERFAGSAIAQGAGYSFRSGLFDWLGTPPYRNAPFIDAGLPGYEPGSVIDNRGRAYWATHGFHAFHAFRVKENGESRLDIAATFATMSEKFAAQRRKFLETDTENTVFVLGNGQNNLDGVVYGREEAHEFHLDSRKIDRLQESLDRFFGADCRLVVVSRADRFDGDPSHDPRVRLLPPEDSEWKGSDADWDEALSDLLGIASGGAETSGAASSRIRFPTVSPLGIS